MKLGGDVQSAYELVEKTYTAIIRACSTAEMRRLSDDFYRSLQNIMTHITPMRLLEAKPEGEKESTFHFLEYQQVVLNAINASRECLSLEADRLFLSKFAATISRIRFHYFPIDLNRPDLLGDLLSYVFQQLQAINYSASADEIATALRANDAEDLAVRFLTTRRRLLLKALCSHTPVATSYIFADWQRQSIFCRSQGATWIKFEGSSTPTRDLMSVIKTYLLNNAKIPEHQAMIVAALITQDGLFSFPAYWNYIASNLSKYFLDYFLTASFDTQRKFIFIERVDSTIKITLLCFINSIQIETFSSGSSRVEEYSLDADVPFTLFFEINLDKIGTSLAHRRDETIRIPECINSACCYLAAQTMSSKNYDLTSTLVFLKSNFHSRLTIDEGPKCVIS